MTGWEDHVEGVCLAGVRRFEPVLRAPSPDETLEQLLARVGRSLGVSWEDLKGPSRRQNISRARKIAAAEAHDAGYSSPAIGAALGGRHHSTILAGIKSLAPLHDGGATPG